MTDYKFGDIVLVPFPFTDQTTTKKRPAVIVSSSPYHVAGYYGDVRIQGWQQAGLLKPSVIKPILTTVEKSLVLKKLGKLEDRDRTAMIENLQRLLGD